LDTEDEIYIKGMDGMNPMLYNLSAMFLSLESSTIVQGTKNLLNDASKALLVILPIAAGAAIIFCAIRRMMSDEHEIPTWNKRMAGIAVAAVIGVCASAIISVVTGYYSS